MGMKKNSRKEKRIMREEDRNEKGSCESEEGR